MTWVVPHQLVRQRASFVRCDEMKLNGDLRYPYPFICFSKWTLADPIFDCSVTIRERGFLETSRFYFHIKHGQVAVLHHDGACQPAGSCRGNGATRKEKRRAQLRKGVTPGSVTLVVDEQWGLVCGVPVL